MLHKSDSAGALALNELSSSGTIRSLTIEESEWLTSEEAARYLRVTEQTLRNMTSNGRVPYYKLGRSNRYLRSELKSLLVTQSKGPIYGNRIR